MALAWAVEPAASSVPEAQLMLPATFEMLAESPPAGGVASLPPFPLELQAVRASVPAARSAAAEVRRYRPTWVTILVRCCRVAGDARSGGGPGPVPWMNRRCHVPERPGVSMSTREYQEDNMTRISLDPPNSLLYRMGSWYSKRKYGAEMEPLAAMGHHPKVLRTNARAELSLAKWNAV